MPVTLLVLALSTVPMTRLISAPIKVLSSALNTVLLNRTTLPDTVLCSPLTVAPPPSDRKLHMVWVTPLLKKFEL